MILTYKVRHHQDFSTQLRQAKQVAKFAIANRDKLSSKHVAHFGLKSAISNQILRKYGGNKKCKKISRVKLIVPNQSIKWDDALIKVTCLKLQIPFKKDCQKINQIEIDNEWCHVSVTIQDDDKIEAEGWLGIDRNTTGHCAVAACTKTSKVMMLGKQSQHIHKKYSATRRKLQVAKKLKKLKTIKRRESRIQKDLNHKISRKVVNYAKANNCGIKLEQLKGIRQRTRQAKSFRYSLNSWAYHQLQQFVEYKAQLAGVPVVYIEPAYTSKNCHKCGQLGKRNGKVFKCPHCGYASHADTNAAWNIALSEKLWVEPKPERRYKSGSSRREVYNPRLQQEEDCCNGSTDTPQLALPPSLSATKEPQLL